MGEVEEILDRTERMLKASYTGVKLYSSSEGDQKIIGLYNAATFGRSVTLVLQNLRGKVEGFDEWYDQHIETLKEDPVCKEMVQVRNRILKEGDPGLGRYVGGPVDQDDLFSEAPPWADGVFLSDQFGGNGFYILHPDGSKEKFYYDFEALTDETGLFLQETQENTIELIDLKDDLRYYVKILAELVSDAKERFGN